MKKRLLSVLLSVLMVLMMLPSTVLAAEDENGVNLTLQISNAPKNGEFFVAYEEIECTYTVTNNGSEAIQEVMLYNPYMTQLAEELKPGESVSQTQTWMPTDESVLYKYLTEKIEIRYQFKGQTYALEDSITVKLGADSPELSNVDVFSDNGKLNISFYSNTSGEFAYAIVGKGETAPDDWSSYSRNPMDRSRNAFTVSDLPDDGKTLYLMAWNILGEALAQPLEIKLPPPVTKIEDGFQALTDITELPVSEEVELGAEDDVLYVDPYGNLSFGKLMKIDAQQGQMLNLSFYGSQEGLDTVIVLYAEENGSFHDITFFDSDNKNGGGETDSYEIPEDGTYYLAFLGRNENVTGSCKLEASLSKAPEIVKLEDGFRALTDITELPVSEEIELGAEGGVLYQNPYDYLSYGKLMKIEAQQGQMLNLSFYGSQEDLDTVIVLYAEENGSFQEIEYFDHDNKNGSGETCQYILPEDRTYYLAFLGYAEDVTGSCKLEASLSKAPEIVKLEDGFRALTDITDLPVSEEVELGAEGDVLYQDPYDDLSYGKLMKIEAEEGQLLNLGFYGAQENLDTKIALYEEENGSFQEIEYFDHDNKNGYGETSLYSIPENGTYYLAFLGYNEYATGTCKLETDYAGDVSEVITTQLDFTAGPVPVPEEGDLWTWDAASKTLTLQDGFFLYQEDPSSEDLILLPDGATVLIEGKATIYNAGRYSIKCVGDLTIRGYGPQTSRLEILYDEADGIDTEGDLTVENCGLSITADDLGIYAYYGTVSIVESEIAITAGDVAVFAEAGLHIRENSQLNAESGGAILVGREITVSENATINLKGTNRYTWLLDIPDSTNLTLSGDVFLYDAEGALLYHGPWDPSMLDNGRIMVNGVQAVRMANFHEHVYDQQTVSEKYLASDATCTEPAKYYYSCICGEAGTETFAYGEALGHDTQLAGVKEATCTEEGYTGDLVCKVCGTTIQTGTVIPKTAHHYEDGVCTVCGEKESDGESFTPVIVKGANGTWQNGSKDGLSFTSNAEYADFLKVQVDGKDVDAANYTVQEGSTIVTLKASYLETLSVGEHTLSVISRSGTATTTFTIQAAESGDGTAQTPDTDHNNNTSGQSPDTGVDSSDLLWIVLICVSGAALITLSSRKKRQNLK